MVSFVVGTGFWVPGSVALRKADVVLRFFVLFGVVLFVETDELSDGLLPGEDADGFDWITATEIPTTFFWSTVLLPGVVDGDGERFAFVFVVAVVPVLETFVLLLSCFVFKPNSSKHESISSMMALKMINPASSKISQGCRSEIDEELFIVHK